MCKPTNTLIFDSLPCHGSHELNTCPKSSSDKNSCHQYGTHIRTQTQTRSRFGCKNSDKEHYVHMSDWDIKHFLVVKELRQSALFFTSATQTKALFGYERTQIEGTVRTWINASGKEICALCTLIRSWERHVLIYDLGQSFKVSPLWTKSRLLVWVRVFHVSGKLLWMTLSTCMSLSPFYLVPESQSESEDNNTPV